MAAPTKINFKIYQGSTFSEVLRWETAVKSYSFIAAVTKSAPCTITTSTAHGLPNDWRVKITDVGGMTEINSSEEYRVATVLDSDSIELNAVNSTSYKAHTQGGVLEYNVPQSLVGVTGRMQIREKLTSTEVIAELTTENGKILVNNVDKTITLLIDAVATSLYTFSTAVYSLELITGSTVIPFIYGNISLEKEVTR
jgi:hypothetical protein